MYQSWPSNFRRPAWIFGISHTNGFTSRPRTVDVPLLHQKLSSTEVAIMEASQQPQTPEKGKCSGLKKFQELKSSSSYPRQPSVFNFLLAQISWVIGLSFGQVRALTNFRAQNCKSLGPGNMQAEPAVFNNLTIESCESLKWLPNALGSLRAMEYLSISNILRQFGNSSLWESLGLGTIRNETVQSCHGCFRCAWRPAFVKKSFPSYHWILFQTLLGVFKLSTIWPSTIANVWTSSW